MFGIEHEMVEFFCDKSLLQAKIDFYFVIKKRLITCK